MDALSNTLYYIGSGYYYESRKRVNILTDVMVLEARVKFWYLQEVVIK